MTTTYIRPGYTAFLDLPLLIEGHVERLKHMQDEHAATGSRSGYTLRDISEQSGVVWGLKMAMTLVLQQHWSERNDHPVPEPNIDDTERYLRQVGAIS